MLKETADITFFVAVLVNVDRCASGQLLIMRFDCLKMLNARIQVGPIRVRDISPCK